ncbi:hypothetical protein PVAP13_2NG029412 [Panicum virgatum]|uniref:Uncharacterized protein n=1 Tax=Panicum virgatum TaxID=38727 RepID=A0A8T0VPX1_PANVG|nr:hypothetical protein PVAP13_2NG029412 [Panicum virgatum]
MAKHDKSFEGYWEYWQNRDALRNVVDICESNKKTKSKNKGVVPNKESKEFVREEIGPDKEALGRTFPFNNDLMNEIEYEGLCLVDGILPDKFLENGTRIGEITIAIGIDESTSKLRKVKVDHKKRWSRLYCLK